MRARISQRLKRANRIVDKLLRYPTTRLTQMHDIGGCRAVAATLDGLYAMKRRLMEAWQSDIRHVDDYIEQPKADGYRAIHIVVLRHEHLVEIQLRTELQNEWATLVERLEAAQRSVLRDGKGDPEIQAALRDLADAASYSDLERPLPADLARRIDERLKGSGGSG